MRVDLRLSRPLALQARFRIEGLTCLLGPSGAGKTTLLKALAGLVPAEGQPYAGLPPEARPVGYLPQGGALFPHMTALANVVYAMPGPRDEARGAALALLARLGIDAGTAGRRPAQLSGGQRQRVALARALARDPELLLLDEPTSALDPATRDLVMAELEEAIRMAGCPALIVTHDPDVAARADHMAILSGGAILVEGSPREVFAAPGSQAAARLLGFRSFLPPGTFPGTAEVVALRPGDFAPWTGAGPGIDVRLVMVRPEALGLRLGGQMTDGTPVEALLPHPGPGAALPKRGQTLRLALPEAPCLLAPER